MADLGNRSVAKQRLSICFHRDTTLNYHLEVPAGNPCLLQSTKTGLQGFLKRTSIGTKATYSLEFSLPCVNLQTSSNEDMPTTPLTRPKAPSHPKDVYSGIATSDKSSVEARGRRETCRYEEGRKLMERDLAAFPKRTPGTIQVRCSTTLKSRIA